MENRSVTLERQNEENVKEVSASAGARQESRLGAPTQLSDAELHALIEFFQLLDQWDRELVQNVHEHIEVNLCKTP